MITWDGVLRSRQRRAEMAALNLPLHQILTPSGIGIGGRIGRLGSVGAGAAAGVPPTPTGDTGSHEKTEQR